jgi:hypothetical protein
MSGIISKLTHVVPGHEYEAGLGQTGFAATDRGKPK